jgi:CRISPR system Cascade subunit CasE
MAETTEPLHMLQLRLDGRELLRSARRQGLSRQTEDLGYLVHGHLAALFGDLAPQPFHTSRHSQDVEVLAYGPRDAEELQEHAETFALPADLQALQHLAGKELPATWSAGRRLGFEVRVCPVVRTSSATPHRKAGAEVDAFLAACDRREAGDVDYDGAPKQGSDPQGTGSQPDGPQPGDEPPELQREAVYRDWLSRQLQPAAQLETARLTCFRLARIFRRTRGRQSKGSARQSSRPTRPDAVLTGELSVLDGEAFHRLLARGVGRHRAFGFGMLLLRPAGSEG